MTSPLPRVLVVDDRANMVRLLQRVLRDDAEVVGAAGGCEALDALAAAPFDVVLCDLEMPDVRGLDVLRETKRRWPRTEFVLMTAYASVGTAVEAMRLGAFDYLTKPFDPSDARRVVLAAAAHAAARGDEHVEPGSDAPPSSPPPASDDVADALPGLVGASAPMRALGTLLRRVAPSDATILILGETGTGKERVARAAHELSGRRDGDFVAVNCAAIPEELLESELFGHARGAFTGAQRERKGLFQAAAGGTLFLDEIGDMRPSLQAKLTRVLEERVIRRVGETQERPVDVRLVAATHRDLESMVRDETFREDLWYRLNVATLRIPPLRDRDGDVMPLATRFLADTNTRTGHALRGFDADAERVLVTYDWPGNVRQLRAAVERAGLVATGDVITRADLPDELREGARRAPAADIARPIDWAAMTWQEAQDAARDELAPIYLRALMERHGGKVARAARQAGVERESFYRLLRRYGVSLDEFRD